MIILALRTPTDGEWHSVEQSHGNCFAGLQQLELLMGMVVFVGAVGVAL